MTIKITLEFASVDETIVALSKLRVLPAATGGAAPQAPSAAGGTTRRARADKGQKRGEYKPRAGAEEPTPTPTTAAATASVTVATVTENPGAAPGENAATDVRNGAGARSPVAPTATSTSADAPGATASAPSATQAEAQKALEILFEKKGLQVAQAVLSRFGVKKLRDMLPEHYGPFVALANGVVTGTEQS